MNAISGYAEYGYASSYADPMGMGAGQESYWFPDGENSHYSPYDSPKGVYRVNEVLTCVSRIINSRWR